MPSKFSALLVICISIVLCTTTLGSPILDDLFHGFVRDSQLASEPPKDGAVVKRRIYDVDNPDSRLKQISLQSLIGDVENSLFQTALSVGSITHNSESVVPEVKPHAPDMQSVIDRSVIKRHTEENSRAESTPIITDEKLKNLQFATTTESSTDPESKSILLQTTQKVPAGNGVPAHILIDRVAIQPHQGGLPLIPAFQLYHTKVISATFKESSNTNGSGNGGSDGGSTKISIAQTAVQATNAGDVPVITGDNNHAPTTTTTTIKQDSVTPTATTTISTTGAAVQDAHHHTEKASIITVSPTDIVTEKVEASTSTSTSTTTSTTTPSTSSTTTTTAPTTTKLPIVQLKEAEEELKEKVAEIEADPVILTARV